MASIIDSFSKIANANFLSPSDEVVSQEQSNLDIAKEVRDVYDYLAIPGDVLGVHGDAVELDVTAREIIFEPTLIERITDLHSPFRRSISPARVIFDEAGTLGAAYDNATSVVFSPGFDGTPTNPLPFLGWVFRMNINNTLVGEGSITMTNLNSGLSAQYLVNNNAKESVVCFLSHIADYTMAAQLSLTTPPAEADAAAAKRAAIEPPVAGITTSNKATTAGDQYVFYPYFPVLEAEKGEGFYEADAAVQAQFETQNWSLAASNCIVHVYPLYMTRTLSALISSLITADRLGELATFVAKGFATERTFNQK